VRASSLVVVLLAAALVTLPAVHADTDSEGEEETDFSSEGDADMDSGAGEIYEVEEQDVVGEQDHYLDQQQMQEQEQEQEQEQKGAAIAQQDMDLGVAQEQGQEQVEGEVQADAEDAASAAATAATASSRRGGHRRRTANPWTADGTVLEVGAERIDHEGVAAFKDVVGKHLPALVEFYIPTCGHCQGFAPEYERLAKTFAGQPVLIARVNARRWGKLADEYHVSRVPDIRYFPKKSLEPTEYRRPRALEDLTLFLNDYAGTKVEMKFKQVHTPLTGQSVMEKKVKQGFCPRPSSQ